MPFVTFYYAENKSVKLGAIFKSPEMAAYCANIIRFPTQEGCTLTFTIQHKDPKVLKEHLDWRHEQNSKKMGLERSKSDDDDDDDDDERYRQHRTDNPVDDNLLALHHSF